MEKFKTKKHFGQNFLNNKKILEEMVIAGEISKKDVVLEIGPGLGSLTEVLAKKAKKIIAVEKDNDLIPILKEKFAGTKNIEIIHGDILKIYNKILPAKYKIVANIPYYLTSHFLRLFLSQAKSKPSLMVLMIQKEVAERIMGGESLLSLSVKAYGNPKIVRKVSKNLFSPPPKVDSAVIKISDISDKWFRSRKINEEKFFEILRSAFQQKRKMLRHSLRKYKIPEKYGNKRPEELNLDNWAEIIG